MTMTNEEICREYRTAKAPLKQIQILAELNGCKKDVIKQILIDGGEKLPGNMTAPGERKAPKPKAEPKVDETATAPMKLEPVNRSDKAAVVAMRILRDRLMRTSLADDEWAEFCQFARGVMAMWEAME